ncbi:hypothetical protein QR680_000448 [Steinernema hermaphroditum]|uniref:Uncharacterized protein n=1 Tax=Steinernema hermaphroditum TaxID=289476 RepID=A0AA39GUM4_9BILA|nr:hypothetical protein QR680_000448 [Steinernema hermaphroditum]
MNYQRNSGLNYVVVQRSAHAPLCFVLLRVGHDDSAPAILKTTENETEYRQKGKIITSVNSTIERLDWGDRVMVRKYRIGKERQPGDGGFWMNEENVEIETSHVAVELHVGSLERKRVQRKIAAIDRERQTIEIEGGFVFDHTRLRASSFKKFEVGMLVDCDYVQGDPDFWVARGRRFGFPDGIPSTPNLLKKYARQVSAKRRFWSRLFFDSTSECDSRGIETEEADESLLRQVTITAGSEIIVHAEEQPDLLAANGELVEVDHDGEGQRTDQSAPVGDLSASQITFASEALEDENQASCNEVTQSEEDGVPAETSSSATRRRPADTANESSDTVEQKRPRTAAITNSTSHDRTEPPILQPTVASARHEVMLPNWTLLPVDVAPHQPPSRSDPSSHASASAESFDPSQVTSMSQSEEVLNKVQTILPHLTKYREIKLIRGTVTAVDGGTIVGWRIIATCDTD